MILADFHLPRRLRPALARAAAVACDAEDGAHVVDGVELALRSMPAGVRTSITLGLAALELSPLLRHRRLFSRLDDDAARAWFGAWWSSPAEPLSRFARALKSLIALVHYDTAPVRDRLAFHPDVWIAKVARRRLESYGAEIARADEIVRAPDPFNPRRRRHA
jgi:hypothetical protein